MSLGGRPAPPTSKRVRTYLPLQRMEPLVSQVAVGSLQREEQDSKVKSLACSISEHFTGQQESPSRLCPAGPAPWPCRAFRGMHQAEPLVCKTRPEVVTWGTCLK